MTREEFVRGYAPELNASDNIKWRSYATIEKMNPVVERVWSIVECESRRYLVPGFAVVNATGRYVVTKNCWTELSIEVRL